MARALLLTLLLPLITASISAQEIRAGEQITVERVILDVYVTDASGNPVRDLKAENFRVKVGSQKVGIESAEWIGDGRKEKSELETFPGEVDLRSSSKEWNGRLIVMFFQTDFGRAKHRMVGQSRMMTHAREFVDRLPEGDQVAVLSYDSQLKLLQDFTTDKERLYDAIERSIEINAPPLHGKLLSNPSIKKYLDVPAAERAASPEKGLHVLARALKPIDGPKTLIMFGWGLGVYMKGAVVLTPEFSAARYALEASRTSLFSLDISDADYHTLEGGLGKMAKDTGGFYVKTHIFPRFGLERLEKTIEGHYELVLKVENLERNPNRELTVELEKASGVVMTRSRL